MTPIGPYCHLTVTGPFVTISAIAGIDPTSGELVGTDVFSQTRQILKSFQLMLESIGGSFKHVTHVNVFLKNIEDFEEMNRSYSEAFGKDVPARTVIGVSALPKKDALLTMSLNAIVSELTEF